MNNTSDTKDENIFGNRKARKIATRSRDVDET